MQFDRGMVGVILVVFSLIAGVGLGLITNIETTTVQKDVESYVADITGAFDSDKEQSYMEYNPAGNYNGYSATISPISYPVDFEEASGVNNYPISYEVKKTSTEYTSAADLPLPTNLSSALQSSMSVINLGGIGYSEKTNQVRLPTGYYVTDSVSGPMYYYVIDATQTPIQSQYNINNLSSVIDSFLDDADSLGSAPDIIKITIPATVKKISVDSIGRTGVESSYFSQDIYYLTNNISIFPKSGMNYSTAPYVINGIYQSPYTNEKLQSAGVDNSYNTVIEYDVNAGTFGLYINNTKMYNGNPDDYYIGYGVPYALKFHRYSQIPPSGTLTSQLASENVALPGLISNIQVDYITSKTTEYLDTRFGVGVKSTATNTIWTNNQQNGVIDIAFSIWNDSDNTFTDNGTAYTTTGILNYSGISSTDTFTVSYSAGMMNVTLNGNTVNIGSWKQILLSIDTQTGKVIATPMSSWNNFNDYSLSEIPTEIGTLNNKANILSINWTGSNSLRLTVERTMVFYNTYGVIMNDAKITVSNLWPNYNRFAVNIGKVATVGDAVMIGTTSYPVTDNNITVNGKNFNVTEMKLSYTKADNDSWNVTVVSGKESQTINVPSTYIQFVGAWYFTAGFYEIVVKEVSERIWDPSAYNWFESNLFFWMAIFLLIGGIVAYKTGFLNDWLSILILIASEIILIIIGGTT